MSCHCETYHIEIHFDAQKEPQVDAEGFVVVQEVQSAAKPKSFNPFDDEFNEEEANPNDDSDSDAESDDNGTKKAGVWAKLKINPFADIHVAMQAHPNAFALPGLAQPATGVVLKSRKDRAENKDPFAVSAASTSGTWNPFEPQAPQKDDPFSVKDVIASRKSADAASGKDKAQMNQDALRKARMSALKASQMFEDAMKEDSDNTTAANTSDAPFTIDPEFMSELEKRRRAREAEEAAHAEQLKKEFMEKKRVEDERLAQELAAFDAKKQEEERQEQRRKVIRSVVVHAAVDYISLQSEISKEAIDRVSNLAFNFAWSAPAETPAQSSPSTWDAFGSAANDPFAPK